MTRKEPAFVQYNPQQHDQDAIARLIFESDPEMNTLVYGPEPVAVIRELLDTEQSYYLPEYTLLAVSDDRPVGVVTAYPTEKRAQMDSLASQGMMQSMGTWQTIRKMPLFLKMGKMLGGDIRNGGLYIHTL
ncbi:hypothetical protein [Spirochaeta africana]|uniref:hypothetical protein n=1 Tax=Spirochaeta africana TaxID=46355 RepID=UPI0002473244|nr:hypothetical protein [Spirochaeta africana]